MFCEFVSMPKRNHEMKYECDARKDKPIQGRNPNEPPIVKITDNLCRTGVLKVVAVNHASTNKGKYSLHVNYLFNSPNGLEKPCNDVGVASYDVNESSYIQNTAMIHLKSLFIRHQTKVKKETGRVKKSSKSDSQIFMDKWADSKDKFGPYEIGFGDVDNLDYQNIRLCCQMFFSDNTKSEIVLSEPIFNGSDRIQIEKFYCNKSESDELMLHAYVKKLTKDQIQGKIVAKFYSPNKDWLVDKIEPEYTHHDFALVFKVPKCENNSVRNDEYCEIYSLNKVHYCSDPIKYYSNGVSNPINNCNDFLAGSQNNNFENEVLPLNRINSQLECDSCAHVNNQACNLNILDCQNTQSNIQEPSNSFNDPLAFNQTEIDIINSNFSADSNNKNIELSVVEYSTREVDELYSYIRDEKRNPPHILNFQFNVSENHTINDEQAHASTQHTNNNSSKKRSVEDAYIGDETSLLTTTSAKKSRFLNYSYFSINSSNNNNINVSSQSAKTEKPEKLNESTEFFQSDLPGFSTEFLGLNSDDYSFDDIIFNELIANPNQNKDSESSDDDKKHT